MARNLEVARLLVRLEGDMKGLEQDLGRSEKALGRIADVVRTHPVPALGALAAAGILAAKKLGDMAAEFQHQMAEIGTLVDKNSVDMKRLADDTLALFASLPVASLQDMTKGLYNIVSAGIPAGEAIDFLRTAAEASIGGVTDVNTAVDGLTTAVNAFASQGLDAKDAADAFFVAVKAGKTTFGELSSSIGNVAGLANSLGVSLDELLASTSALTLGGLGTSEAMNALRQVFSNIAKPTAELRREYPALASAFNLAALQGKGLTGFLVDLAPELAKNRDAAVKMFGSVEALNAVLSLTADGGARLTGITQQMADKAGAAAAAYGEMARTTKNQEQILRNELTAAMTEFGERVLPAVNAKLEVQLGLLRGINTLMDVLAGKSTFKPAFVIGEQEIEHLQRVLSSPLFGGRPIDLTNLKTTSAEFKVLTSAVFSLGTAMRHDVTDALKVSDAALAKMRETVLAYGRAHVKSLDAADAQTQVLAQGYLDMLKFIDAEIAKRKKPPQPPPPLSPEAVAAGKEAKDALTAILKAARDSQLALLKTQHAEYLRLTEDLNAKLATLRDEDRAQAEAAIQQVTDNLLLKWANFTEELDARPAKLRITTREDLDRTTRGVQLLKLETRDFTGILAAHGKTLDDDTRKKLENEAGARELRTRVREMAGEFTFAIGAIAKVADEFGLLDDRMADVLQGLGGITQAIGQFAAGNSLGGTLTGLASIATILKGVLGESPQAQRARAILEHNSQVIEANTNALLRGTPGATVSGVGELLQKLVGEGGTGLLGAGVLGGRTRATEGTIRAFLVGELAKLGLGFDDFEELAKALDIQLDLSNVSRAEATLRQFLERLGQSGFGFGNTFADALERIRLGLDFGTITPEEELSELLTAAGKLTRKPGAILQAFEGLDVTSESGRTSAITRLQRLFENFDQLSPADFGDLTRDEFLALIGRLLGILRSDRAITPPSGIPPGVDFGPEEDSPGTTRPTTPPRPEEDVVLALDSGFDETNRLLELIALNTAAAFQPVGPPDLSGLVRPDTGPGLGGVTFQGGINVSVSLTGADAANPAAAGAAIAAQLSERLIAEIDRALARRQLQAMTVRGDASRTL